MTPSLASDDDIAAWRDAADALPVIVYTLAPDGRVEYVNRRWYEQTGQPPDRILADAWRSVVHPSDLEPAATELARALAEGTRLEIPVRARTSAGTYRAYHSTAEPQRDVTGRVVRWFGTMVDIEDLRSAERSRDVSKLHLQTFLETVPQIVWTADASGWVEWYNARWFEFTGQTPDEAAGWGWQNAHHPDDFPGVMERWPRSIETGEPFEMEFRLRRHDGEYHWFLTRSVPLRDETGAVVRWYGTNTDIEEQVRAQQRATHIARTLQEAFLPERLPARAGLRFDAIYVPAESDALVGGDWYDAVELPGGAILFSCGDVAGHGIGAAVTAGRVRQAIAYAALDSHDPGAILARANALLDGRDDVATALVARIDADLRTLHYASAGHPPPVVVNGPNDARLLPYDADVPLGVLRDLAPRTHAVALEPDAIVALYTDGLIEFARDLGTAEARLVAAAGSLFGDVRAARPATALRQAVMGDAVSPDDVALLVLQCSQAVPASVDADVTQRIKRWRFHSSDARTARGARKELMAYLEAHARPGADLYGAELVLGEILANTVEHAPGLVEIAIDWREEHPVLVASDAGPGLGGALPRTHALPDPLAESGRGFFLIRALARELRVRSLPGFGTEVRAVLDVPRAAVA